jgi:hypothetical protein
MTETAWGLRSKKSPATEKIIGFAMTGRRHLGSHPHLGFSPSRCLTGQPYDVAAG